MKFLYKHEKYANLIFIKTIPTSRHMYVLSKLEVYIHIQTQMSPQRNLHETQMTQGYTCIAYSFNKINIYMKLKYIIIKTCPKIRNTSQNVWAIKTRLY